MSSPTTPPLPPNIVCVCPYCKTGYEWCNCLAEEADTEEAWDADFITCDYCGNRWDGYAQCTCWGDLNYSTPVIEDEDEEDDEDKADDEDEADIARNANGGGTIIEIDYGTTTDEEED